MVRCSNCGSEVKKPLKTWTVTMGKVKKTKITFASFTCEKCHKKFKVSIKKENVLPELRRAAYPPIYMRMIV